MTDPEYPAMDHRPLVLDPTDPTDAATLRQLAGRPGMRTDDLRAGLRAELDRLTGLPPGIDPAEERWIYYPWRRALVAILGPAAFRAIRSDRNRNKLTSGEQQRLAQLVVGVVGQSVGHSIAYTLALEGGCGLLRLADFDTIELSNLNRVPGGLFDVGVNKSVVTARRIAELDPFLPVEIWPAGVLADTVDEFLDGLSVVVEECDSLDIKFAVREAARRHRIPLLMETSDRGLFDVERYDLEPDREPFHGLLGATTGEQLAGLDTKAKAPHVLRILDPGQLSSRMAASLAEIGETITTWPQLGSDVQLGAAIVTAAVRRIGLGAKLSSGRTRVDLEAALDSLAEPGYLDDGIDAVVDEPVEPPPADPVEAILACAQRAPSGQHPAVAVARRHLHDRARPRPRYDHRHGRAPAWQCRRGGRRTAQRPRGRRRARLARRPGTDRRRPGGSLDRPIAAARGHRPRPRRRLSARARQTHQPPPRRHDAAAEISPARAGRRRGGRAGERARDHPRRRAGRGGIAARRQRSCPLPHPQLHEELYAELRWPGEDSTTGIDVRTLDPAPDELAKMQVGRRTDVMDRLREWSAGSALGEFTVDRVRASSALVAITFAGRDGGPDLADYARAGAAVERVWLRAHLLGLAVQPVSPVFLYADRRDDLHSVSPEFTDTLASIQRRFLDLLGIPEDENVALVLRLSYAAAASVRSRRLPVPGSRTVPVPGSSNDG